MSKRTKNTTRHCFSAQDSHSTQAIKVDTH